MLGNETLTKELGGGHNSAHDIHITGTTARRPPHNYRFQPFSEPWMNECCLVQADLWSHLLVQT